MDVDLFEWGLKQMDGEFVIRHLKTGEIRNAELQIVTKAVRDEGRVLLVAQVWTWDHPVLSHSPLGQSVKMAINASEAAWYNSAERMETFKHAIIAICLCPREGGWSEWREYDADFEELGAE